MDKNLPKSFIASLIFHIILVVIFSFTLKMPDFEQKINLEPIQLDIQTSSDFNQVQSLTKSSFAITSEKSLNEKVDQQIKTIQKIEESKINKIDKKEEKSKTDNSENKPLITPIESKSSDNKSENNEIIKSSNETTTSTSNTSQNSTSSDSDQNNTSSNESNDDIVQQLLASSLGEDSKQNAKDNIQWNSGANRWAVKKVKPVLPKKYQEKGNTISCKIYIEINKFGSVISAIIIQSTGYPELDQYIISVIKDWKFNQVTYDKIDSGYITIIFVFS